MLYSSYLIMIYIFILNLKNYFVNFFLFYKFCFLYLGEDENVMGFLLCAENDKKGGRNDTKWCYGIPAFAGMGLGEEF